MRSAPVATTTIPACRRARGFKANRSSSWPTCENSDTGQDITPSTSILARSRINRTTAGTSSLVQSTDTGDADLRDVVLRHKDLRQANLRRANLEGATVERVGLDGACLAEAKLRGAVLGVPGSGVGMTSADLTDADLSNATIVADLSGSTLQGADLRGADLRRSTFTYPHPDHIETNFQGAKYDERTQWRLNFDPDTAGAVRV